MGMILHPSCVTSDDILWGEEDEASCSFKYSGKYNIDYF